MGLYTFLYKYFGFGQEYVFYEIELPPLIKHVYTDDTISDII